MTMYYLKQYFGLYEYEEQSKYPERNQTLQIKHLGIIKSMKRPSRKNKSSPQHSTK